jgi:hypothetical protein
MFTSVYLKWLHQDLYEEFGRQRGFESSEEFQRAVKANLSFQKMFDNQAILERLCKMVEEQKGDREKEEEKAHDHGNKREGESFEEIAMSQDKHIE